MKVYFVRHGQSLFNKEGQGRHQFPDTPLSEDGLKQAEAIAQRFTHINLDVILASSYTRALQTAQAIEKIKKVPLIQSDLLVERKLPTSFQGKLHSDPAVSPIHQEIRNHYAEPNWHYEDEENFSDLMERTRNAFDFILSQGKENIVVVSHGYFLMLMISFILFGEEITPHTFRTFMKHTVYSNTGLTMCEYKDGEWKLLTWNDYAHLGE